jgi:hypothetical protein
MTARSKSSLPLFPVAVSVISLCAFFAPTPFASAQKPSNAGASPFQIELQDAQETTIAGSEIRSSSSKPALAALTIDREYQPGDRLLLAGPRRMAVRVDAAMPDCLLYFPGSPQGNFTYEIPYGREEKQTGSAYSPESFAGKSHSVYARTLNKKELSGYRNLALNPCDLFRSDQTPAQFFPHASSNSASRELYDFQARNAIDGVTQNGHHGVWPYQSWGPGLRLDLWWKVDFGRPVELDKIRLMVRADFPHDSYWKTADVEFSDGTHLPIQIASSAEFQDFSFPRRRVSWVRITNLVPADPARWCSFIEVEAWGHDLL